MVASFVTSDTLKILHVRRSGEEIDDRNHRGGDHRSLGSRTAASYHDRTSDSISIGRRDCRETLFDRRERIEASERTKIRKGTCGLGIDINTKSHIKFRPLRESNIALLDLVNQNMDVLRACPADGGWQ